MGTSDMHDGEPVSERERELNSFTDPMTSLIGQGASGLPAELWLSEPACMECAPGWEGFN